MEKDLQHDPYLWLIGRIPGVCVIETDAEGTVTRYGVSAEAFFGYDCEAVLGRMHYEEFHDPVEMERCRDDPDFQERMKIVGWSEEDWTIVPHEGESFRARVTLVRSAGEGTEGRPGWIALYRRIS